MIASGRSERGLSEVHPHAVAEPRGDLAHDRPLAAIAVAAAAEDDAEPAARELRAVVSDALEGVGRVGVVDDDQERLAGPHLLEASRHGADRREGLGDGGRLEAQREPDRHGPEQVHHVVLADRAAT